MSNSSKTHADLMQGQSATARPTLARDNTSTDRLLSYYQSALAGQGSYVYDDRGRPPNQVKDPVRLADHKRESSVDSSSSSSSDYSVDSPLASPSEGSRTTATPPTTSSTARVRRRSSVPSEGGEDRRRLAIVEMDSPTSKHLYATSEAESLTPADNIRSRRGVNTRLGGLALMAPPDAAPRTYTQLTPPPTAPIVGASVVRTSNYADTPCHKATSANESNGHHHRSASEAMPPSTRNGLRHKSSRDIGIIGTSLPFIPPPSDGIKGVARRDSGQSQLQSSLKPPVFQQPQTRSPSPGDVSDASDSSFRRNLSSAQSTLHTYPVRLGTQPILTPEIGQEKQIGAPVASPVVLNMNSIVSPVAPQLTIPIPPSTPLVPYPSSPSPSYLLYQPGLHAKAGPLPPPPKAFGFEATSPPPPRPPRLNSPPITRRKGDIEAMRQALQLPPSVSAVLASKIPATPPLSPSVSKPSSSSNTPALIGHLGSDASTSHQRDSPSVVSTTAVQGSHISAKPIHLREGAFPPSAGNSLDSAPEPIAPTHIVYRNDPSSAVVPPLKTKSPNETPRTPEGAPSDNRLSSNATSSPLHATPLSTSSAVDSSHIPQNGTNFATSDVPPPGDWVSINVAPATPAVDNETHRNTLPKMPRPLSDDGSDSDHGPTPSPPPKSFRSSWTAGLKRFSTLPRTPSPRSKRSSTSSSVSRPRTSRTHSRSPSPLSTPLPSDSFASTPHAFAHHPPRVKFISLYPPAMFCGDVTNRRTAVERCAGYAAKINELYNYDCGLAGWLVGASVSGSRSPRKRGSMLSSSPSHSFTPQARHTSGSSMTSEVTFPRRADATLATDLSFRPSQDTLPPTSPPPLPYPSLAIQPPSRSSTMVSSPSSLRTLVSPTTTRTGFFASLGRRTSLKKERPHHNLIAHPPNRLMKSTSRPDASPHPRPINIANSPSVPGGPRAPPNRMGRASTIMISSPMSNSSSSLDTTRSPSVERNGVTTRSRTMVARPPQNRPPSSGDEVLDIRPDPDFARQVDKLADLLPHADKDILAGYLRRAGQDMMAIGQYLEDEKNGTLRRD